MAHHHTHDGDDDAVDEPGEALAARSVRQPERRRQVGPGACLGEARHQFGGQLDVRRAAYPVQGSRGAPAGTDRQRQPGRGGRPRGRRRMTVVAYRLMVRIGRLPEEERVRR